MVPTSALQKETKNENRDANRGNNLTACEKQWQIDFYDPPRHVVKVDGRFEVDERGS